ncbi:MAG TPA: alpha-L-fucosidase C-terminal domain-containing protein [Fimbriimonadaceae bacterium]|nr:alpha-L-fucosidase C-terminal domain-containing protein [Fimbriimonadaceae bacterium]
MGYGEGPHNSGGGGFSNRAVEYNCHDFRFTQKGNVVYAIAMDWPAVDRSFLIRSLSLKGMLASGGIASVSLLGRKEPLVWKLTGDGLQIVKPDRRPCDGPCVFKITMRGIAIEKFDAQRIDGGLVKLDLTVRNLESQKSTSGSPSLSTARRARP